MSTESEFVAVGSLQPFEAERILPRLVEEKIRFQIDGDDRGITRLGGVTAAYGGSWGNGSVVRLYVHPDDGEKAGKILGEFFKV